MREPVHVLLVEDSQDDAILLMRELERSGYEPSYLRVEKAGAMREALASRPFDIVLCDYTLPRFGASEALQILQESCLDLPFIIVSGVVRATDVVEVMRAGAHDFLSKDDLARLGPAVSRELREASIRADKRRAEEALRLERDRVQTYLDVAGVILIALDEGGRVTMLNRKAIELLGYEAREVLGREIFDILIPESHRAEVRNVFQHLMAGKVEPVAQYENPVLTRNGDEILVLWHNTVLRDPRGNPIGTFSSGTDITELRRMQREVLEKEGLARLGRMTAIVAHEVKNPLAGIRGLIQVLGGRLPPGDTPIVKEMIARIDGLNGILSDMLVFARPRAPHPVAVPVREVLDETLKFLASDPLFDAVVFDLEAVANLEIRADAAMLKSALLNLLINAAQAMDGKGAIHVGAGASDHRCTLRIRDHGPGIPPETRERLFEPFVTTKARGTGLGLPIARQVIEAHGGRIQIDCPAEGGTVVEIDLPLAP